MSGWAEYTDKDRRCAELRVMAQQQGYCLNESLLHEACDRIGHVVSRDTVRADMAWFSEQGLITLELVGGVINVGKLTQRGLDVAQGRAVHPGVKRPSPG